MEWDKIWAINRKVIDPIAPRYTALQKNERVMVNISGISEQCQEAVLNPKVIRGCCTFSLSSS
jgi:bifunctional glutamyl/prolyl-tRNA synthetase